MGTYLAVSCSMVCGWLSTPEDTLRPIIICGPPTWTLPPGASWRLWGAAGSGWAPAGHLPFGWPARLLSDKLEANRDCDLARLCLFAPLGLGSLPAGRSSLAGPARRATVSGPLRLLLLLESDRDSRRSLPLAGVCCWRLSSPEVALGELERLPSGC